MFEEVKKKETRSVTTGLRFVLFLYVYFYGQVLQTVIHTKCLY
jgi:hypothetical protein